ncbi:hypothetical protein FHR24_000714 [Wenyingzhuangia heitensis]|uniref:Secreted protein n=1 Tax=Wenyingzhuangia heitensis TaxID=1487859 RepID=A0ABX0U919_9FLAO|nr:hypothetical protein [Wenyingzhuangia heitensis]NIJ44275.1 hypothetical protein [Wenyingzhuangia heitensis]
MKNLLKGLFTAVVVSVCLTSCTEDVLLEFDDMTAEEVSKKYEENMKATYEADAAKEASVENTQE